MNEGHVNMVLGWLKMINEFPPRHIAECIVRELTEGRVYYTPPAMYDSDFGRVTGTKRPGV